MRLCRLGRVLAVDDDLSTFGLKTNVCLHLRQELGSRGVACHQVPPDILSMDMVFCVLLVEVPHEVLEQHRHLAPIACEVPEAAAPACLRNQQIMVDKLAQLHQEVIELIVFV